MTAAALVLAGPGPRDGRHHLGAVRGPPPAGRRRRGAALEAEAREKAEANLAYAKKGNEILGSVFAGLDPEKIADSGRPLQDVLRDNLRTAVRELEGSAVGDPLTVAEMQDTLALSMRGLGEYGPATALLEKAADTRAARLGPDHRTTLRAGTTWRRSTAPPAASTRPCRSSSGRWRRCAPGSAPTTPTPSTA